MSHCILQMSLILHLVGTDQDPILRVKTTGLSIRAAPAMDIISVEITPELSDTLAEESDDGTFSRTLLARLIRVGVAF